MVPASVRVTMVDGSQVDLTVSPWQNNGEIVKQLCETTGIRDAEYYGLYEMRGTDMAYMYATDNLLDVQLQWSKAERKEQIKKQKGFFASLFSKKEKKEEDYDEWANNPGVRRFLLKRRIYGKSVGMEPPSDKVQQKVLFYTIQSEVALGLHAIDEEPAVKLATITKTVIDSKVLTPIGTLEREQPKEPNDTFGNLVLYDVPTHLAKKIDSKKFIAKVDKLQPNLPNQSLDLWLSEARVIPTFGASFYAVTRMEDPSVPLKMPTELVIAVNYFGLRLIDKKNNVSRHKQRNTKGNEHRS